MSKKLSMKKFSCYFAHPYESRLTDEAKMIIEELESRKVKVINPFDGEDELMLSKYGRTNYYPDPPFHLGVDVWSKDMRQVSACDMLLVYVPDGQRLSGGCGVELFKAWQEKKFIQIISKSRHPVFAYIMAHSNAVMYNSIDDWIHHRPFMWEQCQI